MNRRACLVVAGLVMVQCAFAAETGAPAAATAADPATEPPPPKPGLWEITFVDPMGRGNDQKHTHCLKPGEPPGHVLPPSKGGGEFQCTMHRGHKPQTNIATFNANCKRQGATVTEAGSVAYTEEAYAGQVTATVSVPQMAAAGMKPIVSTIQVRGKRLGDCK